jgi:signal transduction histidine kinase
MPADSLRPLAIFSGLADDQLAELWSAGEEIAFDAGQELFREAQAAGSWWVLLDGTIELSRHIGHEENVIGAMATPGQWAGGFQAWDEHGVYLATGRGVDPGRVLRVPAEQLRDLAGAWFPFGVHLIRGLVNTVRSIETMARQREALVALGTLAAGLAHEINNPASAATRAVDSLAESADTLLASLARLAAAGITAEQFAKLDALRREVTTTAAPAEAGDALGLADREDALSDWLTAHGVDREWLVAPAFAAVGIDTAWCERADALLGAEALAPGLEWVASSVTTAGLLAEVKESTRRVSDLVAAVRSYSQLDRASVQLTDVREGLESTLVMLAPKLRGVTVVREYGEDLPRIEAIAGELNQVWTNLVDNAVDAMGGQGTLTVTARREEQGVVVEVRDTGTGMPPEVQAHAFEPFFTTKEVGSGTGLGLDISRRIVVGRHGGDIAVESRPGDTVLRVHLPPRPPRS